MLDYILHAGSENVVIYFRDNIYIVKYVFICCCMVYGEGLSMRFGLQEQLSDKGQGGKVGGTPAANGVTWSCLATPGLTGNGCTVLLAPYWRRRC